jgi:hypothetical protein
MGVSDVVFNRLMGRMNELVSKTEFTVNGKVINQPEVKQKKIIQFIRK